MIPESAQRNDLLIRVLCGGTNSRLVGLCHQAELTGRYSGFDLQRELVEGVFIHHQRLIQEELSHLEERRGLFVFKSS